MLLAHSAIYFMAKNRRVTTRTDPSSKINTAHMSVVFQSSQNEAMWNDRPAVIDRYYRFLLWIGHWEWNSQKYKGRMTLQKEDGVDRPAIIYRSIFVKSLPSNQYVGWRTVVHMFIRNKNYLLLTLGWITRKKWDRPSWLAYSYLPLINVVVAKLMVWCFNFLDKQDRFATV